MANLQILSTDQPAWHSRSLIEADFAAGKRTLILNNSSGGSVSVVGLEIPGQGLNDAVIVLNRGTDDIILLADNDESITANQFDDDATIGADESIELLYNGLRWEVISPQGGSSGSGDIDGGDAESSDTQTIDGGTA